MTTQTTLALLGIAFGFLALIVPKCEESDRRKKISDAATVKSQSYHIKHSEYMYEKPQPHPAPKNVKQIRFRDPEIQLSTTFKNNETHYQVIVPYINEHGDPDFKLQSERRQYGY